MNEAQGSSFSSMLQHLECPRALVLSPLRFPSSPIRTVALSRRGHLPVTQSGRRWIGSASLLRNSGARSTKSIHHRLGFSGSTLASCFSSLSPLFLWSTAPHNWIFFCTNLLGHGHLPHHLLSNSPPHRFHIPTSGVEIGRAHV